MQLRRLGRTVRGSRGAASGELIGVLPALLLSLLIAAQLAAAGHALWGAALSGRAGECYAFGEAAMAAGWGARAAVVGGAGVRAPRPALPASLRERARVDDA